MGFNSKYTGAQVETILDALNGISYDPITHSFVFEGNIIVTGGAAFRALLGDLDVPTIMDAIVVDEENITFDYTTGQPILTISDELKEKLGGLNEDELERYLTYHKYLTESSIKGLNFVDKKYLENYFKNNAVTLDTNQEIEGIKNFLNGIQINNSSIISYDPDTKSFVFDGNLIVTGGGAFRAALGDLDVPTIMDAVTVDEHTIIKEGGVLKINPNIDLSGGIKPEELQPYLEPYAKIDDVANTYATIVDLSVLNSRINDFLSGSDTDTIINKWKELEVFLSGLSESDNLSTLLSNKANKSTTLAGYGITDAYTKTQIDTSVSAINKTITDLRTYTDNTFVKLDLAQDIKARHNFTNGLKIGGLSAYKSQDDVVFIDANVVVRGGITAWGNNSQTAPTIWDGLPIDNVTIKRDASGLFYAEVQGNEGINEDQLEKYLTTNGYATQDWVTGKGYITGITSSMVTNALGYTPLSTGGGTITATGRRQLSLQSSTDAQAALWLGTGLEQFSKGGFLQYDYSNGSIALVNFSAMANSYSGLAGLFIKRDNRITVGDANLSVEYDVLHSGNYSEYAVKKNMGINTAIADNEYGYGYVDGGWPEAGPAMVFGVGNYKAGVHVGALGSAIRYGYTAGATSFTWRTILDDNNYSNYALPKDGTAVAANRLVEEVVTDLNNATAGRIFTMTSGYGSTAGNKPTEYWVTGLTLAYAQNSSFRRQLAFADAIDESLYLRAEHIGVWGEWSKILTSSNFYDYALPLTGGKISGDLEVSGCLYSSVGNLRIKSKVAPIAGVEIAVSDTDYWQISHRGSFDNNELHFYHNANGTWSNSVLSLLTNGDVATGGNILAKGAITMYYSSDKRLKQNIRKVDASKTLLSLGGVYKYEYIDSEVMKNNTYGGSHYGLIYQNVKDSALTSMCHEREDGMGMLNYLDTNFISLVAGATMENTTEIEKLKKENKNLRIEIELLKQRVI